MNEPSSSSSNPLEQKVIDEALKKCFDPEIPVNIWELGLIYDVSVSPEGVATVKMTLTAPACPVAGSLPGEVEPKIKAIPGDHRRESRARLGSALERGDDVASGQGHARDVGVMPGR